MIMGAAAAKRGLRAYTVKSVPQRLLNAAKVMSSSQVELPNAARSRTEREVAPQGLKPSSYWPFSARLKSCPDTKRFSKLARNRLTRTLVLQSSIKPCSVPHIYGTAEAVPFVQRLFLRGSRGAVPSQGPGLPNIRV